MPTIMQQSFLIASVHERAFGYNPFADYVPLDDEEIENLLIEKATAETDK